MKKKFDSIFIDERSGEQNMANNKKDNNNMNNDINTFIDTFFSLFNTAFNKNFFNNLFLDNEMLNNPEVQQKLQNGPVYWGYSTIIGPDGKPETKVWGNITSPAGFNLINKKNDQFESGKNAGTSEEPFIDVIEEENHIRIIAELPGIVKENINLNAKKNILTISAHGERHDYFKEIDLGFTIDPKSIKTQNNNGDLENKIDISKEIKDKTTGAEKKIE